MKKEMTYLDTVYRDGAIWNLSMMAILMLFPIVVALIFHAVPDWHGCGRSRSAALRPGGRRNGQAHRAALQPIYSRDCEADVR